MRDSHGVAIAEHGAEHGTEHGAEHGENATIYHVFCQVSHHRVGCGTDRGACVRIGTTTLGAARATKPKW